MPYGSSLGVSAPVVSTTAGPLYATQVNAYLAALRVVVEAKVNPGGIDLNTDLSFFSGSTYSSAVDMLSAQFEVQGTALSAVAFPAALYFAGASGNLYVNDASGNQIQLTINGVLNVATTGGIVGAGYGTGGTSITWDSGNLAYKLFASSGVYADLILDDLILHDGSGNTITVSAPSIATDYIITLPTAVPAAPNSLVTATTGGVLGFSATPTITSLTADGVTLTGSAYVKHGLTSLSIPAASGAADNTSLTVCNIIENGWTFTAAAGVVIVPIILPVGASINTLIFYIKQGNTNAITCRLQRLLGASGAVTTLASTASIGAGVQTVTVSFTVVVEAGKYYTAKFISANSGDEFYGVDVSYTRP